MLFSVCFLSLACDLSNLELFSASDILDLAHQKTGPGRRRKSSLHPPSLFSGFYGSFFILSAFDTAFISCFQAVEMLTWTARGALNVTNSATGQENALPPGIAHEVLIAEPRSPQDTHTAPTDPVTEPTLNLVQSSNVFDEEVADIAQVHCDSELFEFELSTSPPCVNVKGNLRRNFEFWKHIGTPSFILNVIERGYLLPFVSFPEPAVFKNNRSSLSHAEFVEEAIQV